ncbi:MAG: hypothetical protein QXS37_05720 [Candidatus Aenigmatarchaeota archaeon]
MKYLIEILDQKIEGEGKDLLDSFNKATRILKSVLKGMEETVGKIENLEVKLRLS